MHPVYFNDRINDIRAYNQGLSDLAGRPPSLHDSAIPSADPVVILINHLYQSILGRTPNSAELDYYQDIINQAHIQGFDVKPSFRRMAYQFFNSTEYLSKESSHIEYVTDLCHTFLNRAPNASEMSHYLNLLASSTTPNELLVEQFAPLSETLSTIAPLPSKVTVESTSVCNIRCVMCPHALKLVHRPKHMSEEMVHRLIPFLEKAEYIELHGIGEPLLSPAFWRLLNHLECASNAQTVVNTNATVLLDVHVKKILASKLSLVNVSMDAATPETYYKIRGGSFENVVTNIRRLVDAKRAACLTHPTIWMNMTLMCENIAEIGQYVRLAKEIGVDRAVFSPINDYGANDRVQATWVYQRDDWVFKYDDQVLSKCRALAAQFIREARQVSEEISMPMDVTNFPDGFLD
ncbi:hypothetical protein CCP4SC76_5600018 [Gammaproteobacteria bacterium]